MHRLSKTDYWVVVRDCLTYIHGVGSKDALQVVQAAEHLMEDNYERDPFYVACDLRNESLKIEDHMDTYLLILNNYYH